jgi:hypothetical protein
MYGNAKFRPKDIGCISRAQDMQRTAGINKNAPAEAGALASSITACFA